MPTERRAHVRAQRVDNARVDGVSVSVDNASARGLFVVGHCWPLGARVAVELDVDGVAWRGEGVVVRVRFGGRDRGQPIKPGVAIALASPLPAHT
jgi:hypothetical protein